MYYEPRFATTISQCSVERERKREGEGGRGRVLRFKMSMSFTVLKVKIDLHQQSTTTSDIVSQFLPTVENLKVGCFVSEFLKH